MKQTPEPNSRLHVCCGDCITFTLETPAGMEGSAYLRTNLARVHVRLDEIIAETRRGSHLKGRDWWDIPMKRVADNTYSLKAAITETGCFEAKTLFINNDGSVDWPHGENVHIKSQPAETAAHNSVYTVFPRQFGRLSKDRQISEVGALEEQCRPLDEKGYSVIPPSGTFRDVIEELDFIIGQMGFKVIQLLPIHPVPTVFARMGRSGSPFASQDFFNVDPHLACEVRDATPLEQFTELVDQVHRRKAKVFIDLPANHTGWASVLQIHHPEWFRRQKDTGKFISPGAWGVIWADLCELDYSRSGLQEYMADVFLFWARQGVDGFRCDAGYMIPEKVWRYIVAKVRHEFPDTVFMLEGLGGKLSVTEDLLSKSDLNWAYSELFQNYTSRQITDCMDYCGRVSSSFGNMIHFAETHDNNRLASVSAEYAQMRTAMSAMFSVAGAFGITNGVEWFASEKVNVHSGGGLNWNAEPNQVPLISRLNAVLRHHPAFEMAASMEFIQLHEGYTLALKRAAAAEGGDGADDVLVLVNLSTTDARDVSWRTGDFSFENDKACDLLSDNLCEVNNTGDVCTCRLEPGSVFVLADAGRYAGAAGRWAQYEGGSLCETLRRRQLMLIVEKAIISQNGYCDMADFDLESLCDTLDKAPADLFAAISGSDKYVPVVHWDCTSDRDRGLMLPPDHFLLVSSDGHFLAELVDEGGVVIDRAFSVRTASGSHIAVFNSSAKTVEPGDYRIKMTLYANEKAEMFDSIVKILSSDTESFAIDVQGGELYNGDHYTLCTSDLGAMAQVRAKWGTLLSKYDAFLSANLDRNHPVDRHVMLSRLRGWAVYRDYSYEITPESQTGFTTDMANRVTWYFDLPVGMGKTIPFSITLDFSKTDNACSIVFGRDTSDSPDSLCDEEAVDIIIRPDIDDRSGHSVTKAYIGAEKAFPAAVKPSKSGFSFDTGQGRKLSLTSPPDTVFVSESEWSYMHPLPVERQRGLEDTTDIFSPGYFRFSIAGGSTCTIQAAVETPGFVPAAREVDTSPVQRNRTWQLTEILRNAMDNYLVRRDDNKTVIAGYPWFLDWGRDTFIALRGYISAGFIEDARKIILQFASFEDRGTIPNMINGSDVSNRDTTDAPLWLFTAVSDYIQKTGESLILKDTCGKTSLLDKLVSIAENYLS